MDKKLLLDFINKYHLNGIINKVLIESTDTNLHCQFISDTKSLMGDLQMNTISFAKKCNVGIYDTTQFIKMLTALDNTIDIIVFEVQDQSIYLELKDENKKAKFVLSHPDILPKLPKNINMPSMDLEIEIDNEFISNFIKSKNALSDAKIFTFIEKEGKLQIVLNYEKNNDSINTITFDVGDSIISLNEPISFNADYMKEILVANKSYFNQGNIYISSKGLMKIVFKSDDYNVEYFLVANA